jgi:hypothetical protein
MENIEKSKESIRNLRTISAVMGFLGAIDSMAIGFYLLSTLFNPILIIDLAIQGYILTPIIGAVTILLIYGSYLIFKNKNVKRGAEINLVTGLILAFLYVYYAYVSQPSLLSWFTPGGIILIMPPILSGIIGKTAVD